MGLMYLDCRVREQIMWICTKSTAGIMVRQMKKQCKHCTMSFGGNADEDTSKAMFKRCREVGINFFDTANVYSGGRSEEILGECISDCRDEIILSTKVYYPTGKDINAQGLSRRHIMLAVEDSLRRLKTAD